MSVSAPDWSRYLESVCEDYAHWWEKYTLTDVTGKVRQASASKGGGLLLDLMAETVPEKAEGEAQREEQAEKVERFTVLDGLRKYTKEHVLLQGAPGSGKSTAMARLLLEEAERARDGQALDDVTAATVNSQTLTIPVLVELRYYDQSLQQLIEDSLQRRDSSLNIDNLEQWLSEGRLLLLLDGVNELPSESARQDARRFRRRYEKTTSMVFTTRKLGEGGDLGIEKKLTMQPLSEAQMREFVQAYLPGQGKAMLAQLGDRLREFGSVPLLLLMLCSVYAGNQKQIPTSLGGIFRRFTQQYDNELKRDVPDKNRSKLLWPEVLQELAFQMMVGRDEKKALVAIPRVEAVGIIRSFCQDVGEKGSLAQAKLWLEDLLKYHLIQLSTTDSIQFRHQLVQEYYAAEKLLRQFSQFDDKDLKWNYLNYLKWTEPLALMAGLLKEEESTLRLIKLSLEIDYELGARFVGSISERWQPKAIKLVEALDISLPLKVMLLGKTHSESVIPLLLSALQDDDKTVRCSVVTALGNLRTTLSVSGILSVLQDTEQSVHRTAVETLCNISNSVVVSGLLNTLNDDKRAVRCRSAEALGTIGDTSAMSGLLKALRDNDLYVRYRAAEALGNISDASAIPELLKALSDNAKIVRRSAAESLGKIGDNSAIPQLLSSLGKDDNRGVRCSVAEALGEIGDNSAVPQLLNSLEKDEKSVRRTAAEALGKIGDNSAVSQLLKTLQDSDKSVRRSAAEALAKIGDSSATSGLLNSIRNDTKSIHRSTVEGLIRVGNTLTVTLLLELLRDNDRAMRRSSAQALGKIGEDSAVSELLNILQDDDSSVRQSAAQALGKIGETSAVSSLINILQDKAFYVRRNAANALGAIGDASATLGLLNLLQDDDLTVRRSAGNALGKIGDNSALQLLLSDLQDNDLTVRRDAANTLGQLGDASAVTILLNTLRDSDRSVRRSAASALTEIADVSAVSGLLNSLKDDNVDVRRSAAEALGNIGDASAVSGLLNSLYDDAFNVRRSAVEALGKIDHESTIIGLIKSLDRQSTDTLQIFQSLKQVQGSLGYYRPFPTLPITTCEVFISYSWVGESEIIANQLDQAFQLQGINIIRDKKDAGYKANIRDFMQQIGQGKCVLVVISDKYLKSENCMFELVEIAKNGDVCDRIFPIVLSDANIYKATARLKYIQYWEQQIDELEAAMKVGGLANLQGITDDLNLYTKIRNNIASLTDTLKNMNTLTPDMHRDSNFETLIEAVKAKLAE